MDLGEHFEDQSFWSETYDGRAITVFQRPDGWHVYLDHVLQRDVLFASPDEAILWLTERIEQGIPGRLN